MKRHRLLLPGLIVALLASPALAVPAIGSIEKKLKKKRKLSIRVEVSFSAPGEVRLTGTFNGEPVLVVKKIKRPVTKRLKLKVNARKYGYRKLTETLDFDLTIEAMEEGGSTVTKDLRTVVPVPLIFLHGLGGGPSSFDTFRTALDLAMPGRYDADGEKPTLVFYAYDSLNGTLAGMAEGLEDTVRRTCKATGFKKVDLVAHSMGGLVARTYLTRKGAAEKVRKCVMLSTPNEGTPLAWLATLASDYVVPATLPEEARDLADLLLDADTKAVLRTFYPDYDWLDAGLLELFLPDTSSPLTDLNAIDPPAGVEFHVFTYSSTGQAVGDLFGLSVGTVERVDLTKLDLATITAILGGGGMPDLASLPLDVLVLGEGDGLVPYRSAVLSDVPVWHAALTEHDMGIGVHGTMPVDPRMWAELTGILTD